MRLVAHRRLLAVLFVVAMLAPPSAAHAIDPEARCTALRLGAAARGALGHLACAARALTRNGGVDATCHAHVDERLDSALDKIAARRGCAASPAVEGVDALVDALNDDLLATVGQETAVARCSAAKLRAAAREILAALGCERDAVRLAQPVEPKCVAKATARLADAIAHAERRLTCGAGADAPTLQTRLDAFAAAVVGVLTGVTPPSGAPDDLTATITGNQIQLAWTAPPALSGKTHVRILRRLNAPPVDAADPAAAVVFFGTAAGATDALTALLPTTTENARTYHYAAFGCTAGGDCEAAGSRTTLAPTIVDVLRAGGYVLHWRHSAATVCQDQLGLGTAATTMSPDWWKSCDAQCGTATARQLDATGVAEATAIGADFDRLAIPIGRVASSEFCRNFTTAALMSLGPTTELRPDITFFVYDEAGRCDASYALIDEVPAAGTNTAIIGHAGFTGTCPILSSLAWSEAAIFKPDGNGGNVFVTRLLWNAWAGF